MNLISYVEDVDNMYFAIFAAIASNAEVKAGKIYSKVRFKELSSFFPTLSASLKKEAYDNLIKDKAIIRLNSRFVLGEIVDGKPVLYYDYPPNDHEDEAKENSQQAKNISVLLPFVGNLKRSIESYKKATEISLKPLTVPILLNIWELAYFIVYQENYRPFLKKEYGQAKTLIKLFGNDTIEMICSFIAKEKNVISLGMLLYKKDSYAKKSKRERTFQHIEGDDSF